MQESELADMERFFGHLTQPVEILHDHVRLPDVELVMVLGGDGTILRAAELVREVDVPLLGVNLGHVGFLAESERADLAQTVEWIARRDYTVEERMTIDVQVWVRGQKIWHTWALNEAAIEKGNRERMLELVTEVDERPLSSFGCDGVVLATPTGSTAYAFSAGGPVVWPEVEALLIVPISAHALFAKPLVVSPAVAAGSGGPHPHRRRGRALVRRPPFRGPPARRARGSDKVPHPGPAGPDPPDAVLRPAGPQVRAAHPRLARAGSPVGRHPHRAHPGGQDALPDAAASGTLQGPARRRNRSRERKVNHA